ncbi:hypothetical protein LXL04_013655 [Taraxacum kok-saghyz]
MEVTKVCHFRQPTWKVSGQVVVVEVKHFENLEANRLRTRSPEINESSGGIVPTMLLEAAVKLTRLRRLPMSEERVPVRLSPETFKAMTWLFESQVTPNQVQ